MAGCTVVIAARFGAAGASTRMAGTALALLREIDEMRWLAMTSVLWERPG